MSSEVEAEAPRPRPLSGGLWTLFSWLRRDEQGSSDSLSSAGSDRTVASFAFLSPAHYRVPAPLVLPPPGPPTDSYRKRVHDRNLRRQHDRDLTLHRKYGLYRDVTVGYDVTSLPAARRSAHGNIDKQERERRATSESLQRRTPYVPGKRRAPSPPVRASSAGTSVTLPHRQLRKRRAPQPPIKFKQKTEEINAVETENTDMNTRPIVYKNISNIDLGCKSEKYVKKEQHVNTEPATKLKHERSFLKQIFDNKKRRSAIETSSIKILPSISELDKQAAEIIEKSKEREQNNNVLKMEQKEDPQNSHVSKRARWICITCLRRFDVSVNRCSFCLSNQKPNNNTVRETNRNESTYTQTEKNVSVLVAPNHLEDDERQQLKKMLKEMKDSLPKKSKPPENITALKERKEEKNNAGSSNSLTKKDVISVTETPTLRIGTKQKENIARGEPSASTSVKVQEISNHMPKRDNTNEIVRKILLQNSVKSEEKHLKNKIVANDSPGPTANLQSDKNADHDSERTKLNINTTNRTDSVNLSGNKQLHTPLRVSSLLNPVYIPKHRAEVTKVPPNTPKKEDKTVEDSVKINVVVKSDKATFQSDIPPYATSSSKIQNLLSRAENKNIEVIQQNISAPNNLGEPSKVVKKTISTESQTSSVNPKSVTSKVDEINQHSRRRELINQLEKSIAKGDERAAAEAAAKLAQLRLSCSVLSFTSQILGQKSNHDGATVRNENQTDNSKPQAIAETNVTKNLALPTSSKSPETIVESKFKSNEKQTTKVSAERSEPGCSKLPVKKVVQGKTSKIDESITSHQESNVDASNLISISVWIEDKEAARGPIKLQVRRDARLGGLRRQAEASLGIAARLQRWIVGRALCADDDTPLRAVAGPDLTAPFYLCLVEFDIRQKSTSPNKDGSANTTTQSNVNLNKNPARGNEDKTDVYTELMQLEQQAVVPNAETFECLVCMEECTAGNGAVLRDCVHSFCRDCLADMIRHCEEPAVPCPAVGCQGTLHEREIRALVSPEEYEKWLARGLAAAESGTRNAFHCRTRDCNGWALCEAGVRKFPCPVCKRNNCVPCQAIHEEETCEQYRSKLQHAAVSVPNQTDEGTKALLESLISRGEALECPECSAIITKKWGCDWVKCSACKTEICWVTRGRRWGPAGRGDTSAGCRCGVDGKRCHPSCSYCH